MRRWFIGHWFWGVVIIIAGVWLATNVAYALGARSITFSNRYGADATIEFMREHERTVVSLGPGVGLQLEAGGAQLHGMIVRLTPGLPVVCWICGRFDTNGSLGQVDFRAGDWLYRAPDDHHLVQLDGLRAETRDAFCTVAYNRTTGERVMLPAQAGVQEQEAALRAHGLVPGEAARLSPAAIGDLAVVSMMSEGCVIFELAFVATTLLWFVFGGLTWVVVRTVRRARAPR
jgi:hypothetical protein